jgi:hypothetical protein
VPTPCGDTNTDKKQRRIHRRCIAVAESSKAKVAKGWPFGGCYVAHGLR